MIDRQALLADLQKLLKKLEDDLLRRSESVDVPDVGAALRAEFEKAKSAERTAQNFEDWRSDSVTQAAAAWVLSCVFVRFLEDNRLIDPPKIAGTGDRLQRSHDEWELYLSAAKQPNERDYLLAVFDELAKLPGTKDVFGGHNPIRQLPNWLSGDAARELLNFFRKIDTESGLLVHDFTDLEWGTRFLGDLYQDLSEAARKKYALLQTPEFVEEFILDRTLEPALDEFGLESPPIKDFNDDVIAPAGFRMIDPACGSGHFLLGSFRRILDRWQRKEPGTKTRELVQRSLDSVVGVDVNPYAVAIARFRLLLAAMKACNITRLADAPAFQLNLACGDSLLHGPGSVVQGTLGDIAEVHHAYQPEDLPLLRKYLTPGIYHAVVANPPYIVPKDRALNEAYRKRYDSCHMKYSLAVPFLERIFRLALFPSEPRTSVSGVAGYTGQITANSFMKREFGKKLIEWFLPQIDLTHVVDTAGAYIPGHGTPTVILFGRNRAPLASTLRTVMGIRGEPSTPDDPAEGQVWTAITTQIDQAGSQSEFFSVADSPRDNFHKHPWSIGGGGASELKEQLEEACNQVLANVGNTAIGLVTLEDDAYAATEELWRRRGIKSNELAGFVEGDCVRDWEVVDPLIALFPHDWHSRAPRLSDVGRKRLWPLKTNLSNRLWFRKTQLERGLVWYEYGMLSGPVVSTPLSIAFADIATHNHFVLDRGGKVFKQTAPVIKLPANATEENHLELIGLLNSSTACFWMKQVCHNKGSTVDQHGARQRTDPFEDFFAFNATKVLQFPIPKDQPKHFPFYLDARVHKINCNLLPSALLKKGQRNRDAFDANRELYCEYQAQLISDQEELDWQCYRLYELVRETLDTTSAPPIRLGERAFEVVLARKVAAGELQTTWFARHGSTPITELPDDWSEDYKKLVEQRIALIESDPNIRLIEQPEYKRRWNTESWESQLERALREWLLDRLESYFDFDGRMNDDGKPTTKLEIGLVSVARLADIARQDIDIMQVGELYRDDPTFEVAKLVAELAEAESVPLLPVLRYKEPGLRKRAEWEQTWDLQRREDAGEKVGPIDVPPKYASADFLKSDYWRLRGKLDVPKERWVSFPRCEGADGTLLVAWAGYDHLQLAQAVSAHYVDVKERLGGTDDPRLVPLLACLLELLPWIKQWHNEPSKEFDGMHMGDYFEGFVAEELRSLDKTTDQIRAWTPPKRTTARERKKAAKVTE